MAFTFKPFLSPKPKQDGTQAVLIRVTKVRKLAYHSTGIFIKASDFNPKSKEKPIRAGCLQQALYNQSLREQLKALEALALDGGKDLSAAELCKQYRDKGKTAEKRESFLAFYRHELERMQKAGNKRLYEKYLNNYNKLCRYLGEKDLYMDELSVTFFKDYEIWLLGINNRNTTTKSLTFVATIIRRAVAENLLEYSKNPFLKIRLKHDRTAKTKLTSAEIDLLARLELKDRDEAVRDIFLFQYYCAGMRIGDALSMRWKNVEEDRLTYRMDKNMKTGSVKLKTQVTELLKTYKTKETQPQDFIFPFLSKEKDYSSQDYLHDQIEAKTAFINKKLKEIALRAGIEKRVTTHTARHSFAYQAVQKTGDVYAVSKALRHSSLKITEQYLMTLDEVASDSVIDTLFD
jgi:integrase/recombinase XerD